MKVAAIQMVSGISLDANLSAARALLDQAARCGAELAVLPEYFCFMGQQDADKLLLAEQPGLGTVQDFLSDAARELKMWIVGGTLPMDKDKMLAALEQYIPQADDTRPLLNDNGNF